MIFTAADQLELNRRDREDERQAADSKAAAEAALNADWGPPLAPRATDADIRRAIASYPTVTHVLTIPALGVRVEVYSDGDYRTAAKNLAAFYGKAVKVERV